VLFLTGNTQRLDFDGKPLDLFRNAYWQAKQAQNVRLAQYRRDYQMFSGFIDMVDRDPDRANIFIPKIRSIVRTKLPGEVKALAGTRPYLPFTTRRTEFKNAVRVWVDVVDYLMGEGNYVVHQSFAALLKLLYGVSFMDATPYWVPSTDLKAVLTPKGPKAIRVPVQRMRLRFKTWAPWEVFVDPIATNLEDFGGCRYLIKPQIASKREIVRMAQQGMYPGLDVQKFLDTKGWSGPGATGEMQQHAGWQILSSLGIPLPQLDSDVGILFRYESEDRYIDVWNGLLPLRDIPNPFKHKKINTVRYIHDMDAHTQNQFWATGESKQNELLQDLYNELFEIAIDSHVMTNQPLIVHDKRVQPEEIVMTPGGRVGIERDENEPLSNYLQITQGNPLPRDHYDLMAVTGRYMDMGATQWPQSRGEPSEDDATATEIIKLDEAAGSTRELGVVLGEQIFLKSLSDRVLSIVHQSVMPDDVVEIVGEERAMAVYAPTAASPAGYETLGPLDIPGGVNMEFQGSDKIANMAIKQRNWKEIYPMLASSPNCLRGKLDSKLLEVYDEDTDDIEEMIIPDEVMMQIQMADQRLAFEQDMERQRVRIPGGQPGGKYKVNSGKQVAEDTAQDVRNTA